MSTNNPNLKQLELALQGISGGISWDNYTNEDEDGKEVGHWKVTEAIYARVDEVLSEYDDLPSEVEDLLSDLQVIVSALQGLEKGGDEVQLID